MDDRRMKSICPTGCFVTCTNLIFGGQLKKYPQHVSIIFQGHFSSTPFKMWGLHCHLYSRRHVGQAVTSHIQWGPLNTSILRLNSYVKRHGFELYLVRKLLRFDRKFQISTNFYRKYNVPGLIIVGDAQQFAPSRRPSAACSSGGLGNLFVKKSFESFVCHTEQYMRF